MGVDRPHDFIPAKLSLPSKVCHSIGIGGQNIVLSPPSRLQVFLHGMLKCTPTQSCCCIRIVLLQYKGTKLPSIVLAYLSKVLARNTKDCVNFQGTAEPHDAASIPKSPNDYTPTDASQTSGGDEGL
ncbi:hypothetical protein Tco_1476131 [Tanacetum coccineum]